MSIICINCQSSNIIKKELYYLCSDCAVVQSYFNNFDYSDLNDHYKKTVFYKRLHYFNELINNINLARKTFIEFDIINMYCNKIKNISFKKNYFTIKTYLKLNNFKTKYLYIYYIMEKLNPHEYIFIDDNTRFKIINMFVQIEFIFMNNIFCFNPFKKKKILNYHFLLLKICQIFNIDISNYISWPLKSQAQTDLHEKYFNEFILPKLII